MDSSIVITPVDFSHPYHRDGVVAMVNAYASDPHVLGNSLPAAVLEKLGERLASHPSCLAWLATEGVTPVGTLVGFVGFSTFAARPLLNIHDLAVIASHRGQGIGRRLLGAAEAHARGNDFCALTLEVRGDNTAAQHLYRSVGFEGAAQVEPSTGFAFWRKQLD